MTVHDIIKSAMSAEYEPIEGDTDAAQHSIDILNELIMDCYEAEQNSREMNGQEPLTAVPVVNDMTDEVPYNDMLVRYALPRGIEWKYCEQNLDQYRADQYRMMYENAKHVAGGGVWLK